MSRLADRHGRVATDLRVSLTDRCNLRCTYCMPPEGLDWTPDEELLTNEELVRLVRIGVERLGIRTVRLTGGEPLLRADLTEIIAAIADLAPRPVIALTTNGIGLAQRAQRLRDAGLDRINVSLDTLDPERFRQITRRKRHADVLAGIRAATQAGLAPVKVNSVLMRGINDDEAPALVEWAGREGVELRFIEQMPLDAQHGWRRDTMVTADEVMAALAGHRLTPVSREGIARGSAPSEMFRVGGTEQVIGIIASVSRPFCGACDRVRLTADGQLRNCLFSRGEDDLRAALRSGADDETVAEQWIRSVAVKRAGHGIDDPSFLQPDRPMSAIGG
ncbi:cyclic pyranopterin monophosphate synthase subunit MoaA [Raineyella antarctica]|uniref:GTP 3',8-cyclase n=2 Tax=Raineyella antarctica TaxID=1577474 RepID=A0A1G6H9L2_9ACTN|nr:cyclic pyranopterin monophosphate synthase subunit MoaA [Raineyella antarctica]